MYYLTHFICIYKNCLLLDENFVVSWELFVVYVFLLIFFLVCLLEIHLIQEQVALQQNFSGTVRKQSWVAEEEERHWMEQRQGMGGNKCYLRKAEPMLMVLEHEKDSDHWLYVHVCPHVHMGHSVYVGLIPY